MSNKLAGPKSHTELETINHAVVFLHGYGADGHDLINLAPVFAAALPNTAFFSPHAPQETTMGYGRQWFDHAGGTFKDREGVDKATALLQDYLDNEVCKPHGLAYKDIVLVGFSMGTMTALHAAPRLKEAVAGVVGYSGAMVFADKLKDEAKHKMPIELVHGDADSRLDVSYSEEALKTLKAAGFDAHLHVIPHLDHGIDQRGITIASEFIQCQLNI